MPKLNRQTCYFIPQRRHDAQKLPAKYRLARTDYPAFREKMAKLLSYLLVDTDYPVAYEKLLEIYETKHLRDLNKYLSETTDDQNARDIVLARTERLAQIMPAVYAILSDDQLPLDEKQKIALELTEGYDKCSEGFLNRLERVRTLQQSSPQHIDDLLYDIRYDIVNKAALQLTSEHQESSHAHPKVFKIAHEMDWGVLPINVEDRFENVGIGRDAEAIIRAEDTISMLLKREFTEKYTFFNIFSEAEKQIRSWLITLGNYLEYKEEGYLPAEYMAFLKFLNTVLAQNPPLEMPDIFEMNNELVVDVQWKKVRKILFDLLIKGQYFEFSPEEDAFFKVLMNENSNEQEWEMSLDVFKIDNPQFFSTFFSSTADFLVFMQQFDIISDAKKNLLTDSYVNSNRQLAHELFNKTQSSAIMRGIRYPWGDAFFSKTVVIRRFKVAIEHGHLEIIQLYLEKLAKLPPDVQATFLALIPTQSPYASEEGPDINFLGYAAIKNARAFNLILNFIDKSLQLSNVTKRELLVQQQDTWMNRTFMSLPKTIPMYLAEAGRIKAFDNFFAILIKYGKPEDEDIFLNKQYNLITSAVMHKKSDMVQHLLLNTYAKEEHALILPQRFENNDNALMLSLRYGDKESTLCLLNAIEQLTDKDLRLKILLQKNIQGYNPLSLAAEYQPEFIIPLLNVILALQNDANIVTIVKKLLGAVTDTAARVLVLEKLIELAEKESQKFEKISEEIAKHKIRVENIIVKTDAEMLTEKDPEKITENKINKHQKLNWERVIEQKTEIKKNSKEPQIYKLIEDMQLSDEVLTSFFLHKAAEKPLNTTVLNLLERKTKNTTILDLMLKNFSTNKVVNDEQDKKFINNIAAKTKTWWTWFFPKKDQVHRDAVMYQQVWKTLNPMSDASPQTISKQAIDAIHRSDYKAFAIILKELQIYSVNFQEVFLKTTVLVTAIQENANMAKMIVDFIQQSHFSSEQKLAIFTMPELLEKAVEHQPTLIEPLLIAIMDAKISLSTFQWAPETKKTIVETLILMEPNCDITIINQVGVDDKVLLKIIKAQMVAGDEAKFDKMLTRLEALSVQLQIKFFINYNYLDKDVTAKANRERMIKLLNYIHDSTILKNEDKLKILRERIFQWTGSADDTVIFDKFFEVMSSRFDNNQDGQDKRQKHLNEGFNFITNAIERGHETLVRHMLTKLPQDVLLPLLLQVTSEGNNVLTQILRRCKNIESVQTVLTALQKYNADIQFTILSQKINDNNISKDVLLLIIERWKKIPEAVNMVLNAMLALDDDKMELLFVPDGTGADYDVVIPLLEIASKTDDMSKKEKIHKIIQRCIANVFMTVTRIPDKNVLLHIESLKIFPKDSYVQSRAITAIAAIMDKLDKIPFDIILKQIEKLPPDTQMYILEGITPSAKTEASIMLEILAFIDQSTSITREQKRLFLEKNKLFSEISTTERNQEVMAMLFQRFFSMVTEYCLTDYNTFWNNAMDYNVLMSAIYYNILEDVLPKFSEKTLLADLFLLQNKSGNNALLFSIQRPNEPNVKENNVRLLLQTIQLLGREKQIAIFSCKNKKEKNAFSLAATPPHKDVSTKLILRALLPLDLTKDETSIIFTDDCLVYVMKYLIKMYPNYESPNKISTLVQNLNLTNAMMLTLLNEVKGINVTILKIFAEKATDSKVFKAILNNGVATEGLPNWVEKKSLQQYIKARDKEDKSTGFMWTHGETKLAAARAKLAGNELTWVQRRALNTGTLGSRH